MSAFRAGRRARSSRRRVGLRLPVGPGLWERTDRLSNNALHQNVYDPL